VVGPGRLTIDLHRSRNQWHPQHKYASELCQTAAVFQIYYILAFSGYNTTTCMQLAIFSLYTNKQHTAALGTRTKIL